MDEHGAFHEDYGRAQVAAAGSDRGFALTFAALFALIGGWPLLGGGAPRWWALVAALVLLAVALLHPALVAPLNRLWARFSHLLSRLMTPLVLAVVFYLALTPTALLLRLFGKRPLQLGRDAHARSYWLPRRPPGPEPESMRKQF